MTDTLIICLTLILALAIVVGAHFTHQARVWQRELARNARRDLDNKRVEELSERLIKSLDDFEDATGDLTEGFADIPKAVLALSERQVVLEGAIKAALAEIVKVTAYEEAKYKALLAKTVTSPAKRPGAQ